METIGTLEKSLFPTTSMWVSTVFIRLDVSTSSRLPRARAVMPIFRSLLSDFPRLRPRGWVGGDVRVLYIGALKN